MVSYIDRTNLSFASIQLSQDLNLSSTIYGLGSGAFFLAYALGQLPSNFLLLRFGGPAWLSAITVVWGMAASAFALVRGPVSFVLLRMLLGLAESGALPGVWYYVSQFYPADRTTLPYSLIEPASLCRSCNTMLPGSSVEAGATASQVVAAPVAAGLLMLDGVGGLRGWQWLFLLEGLPALLLGCAIRYWLPSSIASASFLAPRQREALSEAVAVAAAAAAAAKEVDPAAPYTACDKALPVEDGVMGAGAAAEATLMTNRSSSSGGAGSIQQWHLVALKTMLCKAAVAQQQQQQQRQLTAAAGRGVAGGLAATAARPALPATRLNSTSSELTAAGLGVGPGSSSNSSSSKSKPSVALSGESAEPARHHAGSPGAYVVLLSAIPYAAASLFHLANAWHSQRCGERRWHIAGAWLVGAAALLLLPAAAAGGLASATKAAAAAAAASGESMAASVAAFALLTLAHVGINGANGVQTGLVAANIAPQEKALGLAMYNTIGCFGSFWGPVIIGVLRDATGGYAVAMWLLGGSLAAAAAMVARFKPERLDIRLACK
ncbi:major facilitator superfamily domain-containing protein [Scenedesmus sp. NREL 46B-D3]|nr:major facilitator superfamily domain-containing protein [Scenedesmus sp. NREL 46B-D3]